MKLNVNLPQTPYDIVIEKGILSKVRLGQKLWKPQKSLLLLIIMLAVYMLKKIKRSIENLGLK